MKLIFIFISLCFSNIFSAFAQSTILKLPTNDNSSSFDITQSDSTSMFKLFGDGGFYVGGTFNEGAIPFEGEGTRLMWYPGKAALRVGRISFTNWDDSNIGEYSIAMGYDTRADGQYSTSIGRSNIASGVSSIALGYETRASGFSSTAMGNETVASGSYSISMGYESSANGDYSVAIGLATANGFASIAMGNGAFASGDNSFALGNETRSSGNYSFAMGDNVSTNDFDGAFILGDASSGFTTHNSSAENQMTMRFAGGYRLFTNSTASVGALLDADANSWTTISDSTKKENFIYPDGDHFLNSLSKLKLGSWDYKNQKHQRRHYGPMAQEIFKYFGKDELGTIGNDSTLATADMDGIIMICLQALEKRTSELQNARSEISELKEKFILPESNQELLINELVKYKDRSKHTSQFYKRNGEISKVIFDDE